ncbi:hypothetical protein KCU65_g10158, partial [Aureobasidium melanogenum]
MTSRPAPPILPDNAEIFVQHVTEHPELWYKFANDIYQFADAQESENITLHQENASLTHELEQTRQELTQTCREKEAIQAVHSYQSAELEKTREELKLATANEIRATTRMENALANEAQARQAEAQARRSEAEAMKIALPTVNTPATSDPMPANVKDKTVLHDRTPTLTSPAPESSISRSEKIPNPDKFQGDRSQFDVFASKIREKMSVNYDRFPTAQSRLAYLSSRLEGRAYLHIQPYIRNGVHTLRDYEEGLQVLERAFGDQNRARNAQSALLALRQKNQEFGQFFAEFHRLALESGMHEDALPMILEGALSKELKQQLTMVSGDIPNGDYHAYAKYLQELENRRRYFATIETATPRQPAPAPRQPAPRSTPVTTVPVRLAAVAANLATNSGPSAGEPITIDNVKGRRITEPGVREFCFKNDLCFYCKTPGHTSMNCPNKNRRTRELYATTAATYDNESTVGGAPLPGNDLSLD